MEEAIQRPDDAAFSATMRDESKRTDIDFEFACQKLSDAALHCIADTLTGVEHIRLVGCSHFTAIGLFALARLPELTEVELYGAEKISEETITQFEALFVDPNTNQSRLEKCVITRNKAPESEVDE